MNSNKEVVEEVLGCLRLFSDGTVDRAVSGPPEAELFKEPIAPHEEFIDGVTVCDQIIDPSSGLTVRIYIPETKPDIVKRISCPYYFIFMGVDSALLDLIVACTTTFTHGSCALHEPCVFLSTSGRLLSIGFQLLVMTLTRLICGLVL